MIDGNGRENRGAIAGFPASSKLPVCSVQMTDAYSADLPAQFCTFNTSIILILAGENITVTVRFQHHFAN